MKPIIDKKEINIAMLGMVEEDGHPYSWSAMINGYNKEEMAKCPYPVIPAYLAQQPEEKFGMPGVKVTHIWTDDPEDAKKVAAASKIENIVSRPEDVIGEVDAVIIPTDKGDEHVWRARPFIERGIPVFFDKPLADNYEDLRTIVSWYKNGAPMMSGSSLHYHKAYKPYMNKNYYELGDMRFILMSMNKSWERYGMHSVEAVHAITGPGYLTVQDSGTKGRDIIHLTHEDGFDVVIASIYDMVGTGLVMSGTQGTIKPMGGSSFESFKEQLDHFIDYLRTGERPFPFENTIEMAKIIAAGVQSRNEGGRKIDLREIEI